VVQPSRRLTADEVAMESGTQREIVLRLVAWGALSPGRDGLHEAEDVPRTKTMLALEGAGFGEDSIRWVVTSGLLPVEQLGGMWTVPQPTGRTYADFLASLGERGAHLPAVYAALGLPEPRRDAPTTADEEEVVRELLETWALVRDSRDVYIRAARIAGEGARRMQAATMDLFDELGGPPPTRLARGMSLAEAAEPSYRLAALMPRLLVWLQTRHAEYELFARVVEFVEHVLARSGRIDRERERPAVAFVDLTGYTEMTEVAGDERAAAYASELQGLADASARDHGGRVVKLLGDGVMLRFARSADAVAAVDGLMHAIVDAGLPPAHAGIETGPLVVRDGDVYGRTVNIAARVARAGRRRRAPRHRCGAPARARLARRGHRRGAPEGDRRSGSSLAAGGTLIAARPCPIPDMACRDWLSSPPCVPPDSSRSCCCSRRAAA
jgi:adenylate cyclase